MHSSVYPSRLSRHYTAITIHPTNEDGACEVWGSYEETLRGQAFDSDGIIGWLYPLGMTEGGPLYWIWMSYAGHPRGMFTSTEDLCRWLKPNADTLTWDPLART